MKRSEHLATLCQLNVDIPASEAGGDECQGNIKSRTTVPRHHNQLSLPPPPFPLQGATASTANCNGSLPFISQHHYPSRLPVPRCLLLNLGACRYTGNRRAFFPLRFSEEETLQGLRAKTEWATPETRFFLVLKEQTDCTRKSAHHTAAACRLQMQFYISCSLLLLIFSLWLRVLLQLYFSVRRRHAVQVISLRLLRRRRVRTKRNISCDLIWGSVRREGDRRPAGLSSIQSKWSRQFGQEGSNIEVLMPL